MFIFHKKSLTLTAPMRIFLLYNFILAYFKTKINSFYEIYKKITFFFRLKALLTLIYRAIKI